MHSETLSRYLALKEQGHLIHARDIAAEMGISEAERQNWHTAGPVMTPAASPGISPPFSGCWAPPGS